MHCHPLVNVASRRGVSLWEITGAIVAVVAGVWIGARYIGLDLHEAAYSALSKAEINQSLPEGWQLAPPPGMEPLTPDQQAVALTEELDEIRHEVAQLNSDNADAQAALTANSSGELPPDLVARRQHTLAFWSQLGAIREEVDRLQLAADDALNQDNVYKVLELRRRAYLYGAKAVQVAMTDKVDPQVLHFGEQLQGWYQNGADLYGEALTVWQAQHVPTDGLSSDQMLERIQAQHDNEALLLFQKSGRLSEVLFRRYQVEFPEINNPGSAVD